MGRWGCSQWHIELKDAAAHDKGVGTVIMGIFDENKVSEVIPVPEGQKVAALIAMGYPDEEPKAPRRKTVEDLVTYID